MRVRNEWSDLRKCNNGSSRAEKHTDVSEITQDIEHTAGSHTFDAAPPSRCLLQRRMVVLGCGLCSAQGVGVGPVWTEDISTRVCTKMRLTHHDSVDAANVACSEIKGEILVVATRFNTMLLNKQNHTHLWPWPTP